MNDKSQYRRPDPLPPSLPGGGTIESNLSSTTAKGDPTFGDGKNTSTMLRIEMKNGTNGYQQAGQDMQVAGGIIAATGNSGVGTAVNLAGRAVESQAPAGTIDVSAQIRITGSGANIRVQGWAQSRPFPSVTGYAYTRNADGSITRKELFSQDETKPEDLTKPKRPIN